MDTEYVVHVAVNGNPIFSQKFATWSEANGLQSGLIGLLNRLGHTSWSSHDFLFGGVEGPDDPFIQVLLKEQPVGADA